MTNSVTRAILILHRYLGVVVGAVMTLWCLSGFVMMYQGYPSLTEAERLQGLAPLDLAGCCGIARLRLADDAKVGEFRVEMLGGAPVLRLAPGRGRGAAAGGAIYDLRTGRKLSGFSDAQLLDVAATYGRQAGVKGAPRDLGVIATDQWTLEGYNRNQPIHHVRFDDAAGTEIYIAGARAEVFQQTIRRERVISWFGAVPHWLYPTALRQNVPVWSQVVIWSSVCGVFLTVTGLYIGIARFRRRRDGRWSPFRGWWFWHHMIGLVFGLLTLTWVTSGLLTMNPWGLLEGDRNPVQAAYGPAASGADVKAFVAAVGARAATLGDVRALRGAPFGGRVYADAIGADGVTLRLDVWGDPAVLQEAQVRAQLAVAKAPIGDFTTLHREDDYYYGHHREVTFPVYRAVLSDAQHTRLYIDARTGAVLKSVGKQGRISRWTRVGLHDFDFGLIRSRPIWDVVVVFLLLGVTAVCVTGFWMSLQRIGRDAVRLKAWLGQVFGAALRKIRPRVPAGG